MTPCLRVKGFFNIYSQCKAVDITKTVNVSFVSFGLRISEKSALDLAQSAV